LSDPRDLHCIIGPRFQQVVGTKVQINLVARSLR
jgi:hypothetical protein